jgi:serine protease AprX
VETAHGMSFVIRPLRHRLCALIFVLVPLAAASFPLRPSLAKLSGRDTLCRVWVVFKDKNSAPQAAVPAPRALERRKRAGITGALEADRPVSPRYCADIGRLGCRVDHIFRWANAVSVTVHASRLPDLAELAPVKDLIRVRTFSGPIAPLRPPAVPKKAGYDSSSFYGAGFGQLALMNIPAVHHYLSTTQSAVPGTGILIGLFDSGFRTKHACFSEFVSGGHLVADSDFIDNDGTVDDPDSVAKDSLHPYYHNDEHGSMTLSLIAGYDPSRFAGVAWGARFVLARTEDTKRIFSGEIESHREEDNWAAAMVWAESLGVDIVSSSVAYRKDFTFPDTDYTYRDMDGRTTIISKAASTACVFGVVIVNAIGNEGPDSGSLSAPADVDSVVSVGAVDDGQAIAGFSSRGPTSDRRMKPDCVAQGVGNTVPLVYGLNGNSYSWRSGTSFATPLIAGLCALIMQTHPHESAAATRSRLFSSCVFVPGQTAMNNTYGRGLPNAKLACLPYNIIVTVKDTFSRKVKAVVFYRAGGAVTYKSIATDSAGRASLTDLSSGHVELYAEAAGFFGSTHRNVLPSDTGTLGTTITLVPRPVSQFVIFPNVIDIRKKNQRLRLEFTASADDPRRYSQLFVAAIRSIDGALVWTTSRYLTENMPFTLSWPESGKAVAPGMYYFIVNYAGKTYRRKFLVTG